MTTTELTEPAEPAEPTFRETLDETLPLVGVIPVHGPAAVLIAGPWVLLALLLCGPFVLLLTLAALAVAATALIALVGAILAAPFVLVGRLHHHAAAREPVRARAARLVPIASRWRAA